jgi:hypothetical protein
LYQKKNAGILNSNARVEHIEMARAADEIQKRI